MLKPFSFALAATFAFATPLVAQRDSSPSPWPAPHGGGHALAYDSRRGLTMLYGDRGPDSTTLWSWNGSAWHAFRGPGPGMRRHIKLAYDSERDRLVLYGGFDDSGRVLMSDTWEWDGERWTRVATDGPGPRATYSMTYDPARRLVLLFGGLGPNGATNDTWGWNGIRWTRLATDGPSPRAEAGAVYDARLQSILIAGGVSYEGGTRGTPRDTWAWNGQAWRRLSESGIVRFYAALIPDPVTGVALRIGGESDSAYHGDLWRWEDGVWRLDAATFPPRHGPAAALDTRRRRVVVFGGSSGTQARSQALADLWEWDGVRWHQISR